MTNKDWPFLLGQGLFLGCLFFWVPYATLPLPGYAVGFVAVIAAVMSVHPNLQPWQKAIYLVLIAGFIVTEFRAIRKDQDQSAQKQKEFFDGQKRGFASVATQASQSFATTTNQASQNLAATTAGLTTAIQEAGGILNTTKSIAVLTKENLESVSGGSSYAYIVPATLKRPDVSLILKNHGGQILTGVTVKIVSIEKPLRSTLVIPIGTLAADAVASEPIVLTPRLDPQTGIAKYVISIETQNGMVEETLEVRADQRDIDMFDYRLLAKRNNAFDKTGKQILGPKSRVVLANTGWTYLVRN